VVALVEATESRTLANHGDPFVNKLFAKLSLKKTGCAASFGAFQDLAQNQEPEDTSGLSVLSTERFDPRLLRMGINKNAEAKKRYRRGHDR
jgi:hypothetical protein